MILFSNHPIITNYLCVALGLYVLLESLDPIRSMAGGWVHFCHKLKYVAALAVASWIIYYGLKLSLNQYYLAMMSTIALFVWPRTVFRFVIWLDDVIDEFDLGT